ncbi:S8 family serine peptidase [Candidatus Woesearchaeota archaeon]|nr:S8 family serine peptidase [Candidatus Woesearchaeota archaeon]
MGSPTGSVILSPNQAKIEQTLSPVTPAPQKTIIQFDHFPTDEDKAILLGESCDVGYVSPLLNAIVASCPGVALQAIASRQSVLNIWEDKRLDLLLDVSVPKIRVPQTVLNYGTTGLNINVSILDSGIKSDHPALVGKVVEAADFTTDNNTADFVGHGTAVACVVACNDPNQQYNGVAPNATLFNAKVATSAGASVSDLVQGMDWSIAKGAKVLSVSLGALVEDCDGNDAAATAVNNAVDQGVVVVVGAGNGGPGNTSIYTPGCAEKPITVGATDDNDGLWTSSSRGPTLDGRIKPDVVAPGVSITTANLNDDFSDRTGTSFATPHVSGVAALVWTANPSLNNTQIKQLIKETAFDLGLLNIEQGSGRVDALRAVKYAGGFVEFNLTLNPLVLIKGDVTNLTATINNTGNRNALSVNTTITLPSEIVLQPGEVAMHSLGTVTANTTASTAWRVKGKKVVTNAVVILNVTAANGNATGAFLVNVTS